jgi:putative ABC transport system substrate-binding protein
VRLLGVLIGVAESDPVGQALFAAFRATLVTLGWTEDDNLRIELRWGASNADRIRILAKELVDLQPDAILDHSTPVARALARETRTIPIVFVNVSDPIGDGIVASLAHPGGNMTGFMNLDPAMSGKWVELLKEIAPRTVRAAVLFNPATAPQSRRPDHLWRRSFRAVASGGRIHRPHPQGRQASRPRGPSAD